MHNPFTCPDCNKYHKRGHQEKTMKEEKIKKEEIKNPLLPTTSLLTYDLETLVMLDNLSQEQQKLAMEAEKQRVREVQIRVEEKEKWEATLPTESTELITAYRIWRYDNGDLKSAFKGSLWPRYVPMNKDVYEDMGIHGVKDYKELPALMTQYRNNKEQRMVGGCINMWGVIKDCEKGYLAEYAYPKELYVGGDTDPFIVMTLEENYGVPVQIREELSKNKLPTDSRFDLMLKSMTGFYNLIPPFVISSKP